MFTVDGESPLRGLVSTAENNFLFAGLRLRFLPDSSAVSEVEVIQGRPLGVGERAQIRQLLAAHPSWSRRRLSQHLCRLWEWRNGAGQLKDMAARSLLLKLEQRGWIVLPPRRQTPVNRMRQKRMPALALPPPEPIAQPLEALLPLTFTEVSARAAERAFFDGWLHQHHYLSHRSPVGENLQYLVASRQGQPLACVLFGAAAWQCADRDEYLGWDAGTRAQNLSWIASNTRFLVLPWVRVPQLASHVLGRIARRVSQDWQRKYGHPIYLLESFVERARFAGICYQAANWVRVGQTRGRTRQDRADGARHQAPIKDIYLCPLHPRFRERLQRRP